MDGCLDGCKDGLGTLLVEFVNGCEGESLVRQWGWHGLCGCVLCFGCWMCFCLGDQLCLNGWSSSISPQMTQQPSINLRPWIVHIRIYKNDRSGIRVQNERWFIIQFGNLYTFLWHEILGTLIVFPSVRSYICSTIRELASWSVQTPALWWCPAASWLPTFPSHPPCTW